MLTRTCDRCGATIEGDWFKVEIQRKMDENMLKLHSVCLNSVVEMSPAATPDYCFECAKEIESFARKSLRKDR